jgi:hypothetical protein
MKMAHCKRDVAGAGQIIDAYAIHVRGRLDAIYGDQVAIHADPAEAARFTGDGHVAIDHGVPDQGLAMTALVAEVIVDGDLAPVDNRTDLGKAGVLIPTSALIKPAVNQKGREE